jgi:cytochrome b
MVSPTSTQVKVWDPFVRIAHWTLAVGFFVAYLTEDEALTVHVWAGYLIGTLVLLRILWGFAGPQRARFTDFTYAPQVVFAYLNDLLRARAHRYLGHSPAGGAMVIALLLFLAATVGSGLILYAEEEGAGPLASFYSPQAISSANEAENEVDEDSKERRGKSSIEEVHEALANITLALVLLHIAGVILASFVHRENLAYAMITGDKRAETTSGE